MSIQNIMNVCFAICITLLIYQNTQLKDEIETANSFSQLDVDKSWDRMDQMDITINDLSKSIDAIFVLNKIHEEEITKLFNNFDVVDQRDETRRDGLRVLIENIETNRKNMIKLTEFVGDLHNLN